MNFSFQFHLDLNFICQVETGKGDDTKTDHCLIGFMIEADKEDYSHCKDESNDCKDAKGRLENFHGVSPIILV